MRIVAKIVQSTDVEDIIQEAYLRVHTAVDYEEIREPVAFVTKIAKNLALDHVRSAGFRRSECVDADLLEVLINQHNNRDQTLNEVVWNEELSQFFAAVQTLPDKYKEVYILKKIYGYSQKEISQKLNISASTVEKHIAHGTKKLFHLMQADHARLGCAAGRSSLRERSSRND
ncbi:MAG: RNA polymerase sigma factor [Pseudomonadota bacterium]